MNLNTYVDKAGAIYNGLYSQIDKWAKERENEAENVKKRSYKLTNEAANEEHSQFVKTYNEKLENIIADSKENLKKVETDFINAVNGFYNPNGAAINNEDKLLIDSGILNVAELEEMLSRYAKEGNTTMIRIIGKRMNLDNISKDELQTDIARVLFRAEKGGNLELQAWKEFLQLIETPVRMAVSGYANTDAMLNAMLKLDEYIEQCKINLLQAKLYVSTGEQETIDSYNARRKNYISFN